MKLIYHCHSCGIDAEIENDTTAKEAIPIGWVKREHIDGAHYWICASCASIKGVKQGAVYCSICGKRVSNVVIEELIVRAWVECPECAEKNPDKRISENIHDVWKHQADGACPNG